MCIERCGTTLEVMDIMDDVIVVVLIWQKKLPLMCMEP